MANRKVDKQKVTIAFTIHPDTLEKLDEYAYKFRLSRSQLIEDFIRSGVAAIEMNELCAKEMEEYI